MDSTFDSFLADIDDLDNQSSSNQSEVSDNYVNSAQDLNCLSNLQKTQRFNDMLQTIRDSATSHEETEGEDGKYNLVVDSIELLVEIDNKILVIYNFIRDRYRFKFPELESLVHHPIDYARLVKKIGNQMDLTTISLQGILPPAIIMVISITASTTNGRPLSEETLKTTIEACDQILALDSVKNQVVEFIGSTMDYMAPNLSALVGNNIAAKLIGICGGLSELARKSDIKLLGAKRNNLAGYSTATSLFPAGYLEETEVLKTTPSSLRRNACKLLADKSIIAARVDSVRGDPSGNIGKELREEIHKKLEKLQELPPPRLTKPLPVPVLNSKKQRGGWRRRKMKERFAMTEMRKYANRVQFGVPEESSLGDGLGHGYGMLGQAGNGNLRVSAARRSLLPAKVGNKFKKRYEGSGVISGLNSCLVFTPEQEIMLTNPQGNAKQPGNANKSSYFSETGAFLKNSCDFEYSHA